jgi:hypothetical protein
MKMREVRLGGCLLALLLAGCAPPGPIPPKLATTAPDNTAAADKANADSHNSKSQHGTRGAAGKSEAWEYQTAVNACTDEALKKTTGSILAILSRLRPGAYTKSYVACMKTKGYDVSQ